MPDPASPILDVSQTQLAIQAAAANGRDAIAIGIVGVDAALFAAGIALAPTLGHRYWQPLLAIGVSGLLALAALMLGGVRIGLKPRATYERFRDRTETEIYGRLISALDRAVATSNRRLTYKARLLTCSIATIVGTLILTAALL
jgi:hypothetical protein